MLTNVFMNYDQGILPAASHEIKSDYAIDDVKFGALGSIVYVGLILGSFVAGFSYQKFNTKYMTMLMLMLMMLSLSIFLLTDILPLLLLSRVIYGFAQVFCCVYFPVWVDSYGQNMKTIWLSLLQLGVPCGVFLGYSVTYLLKSYKIWLWTFYSNIILLGVCLLGFLLFQGKNLSIKDAIKNRNNSGSFISERSSMVPPLEHGKLDISDELEPINIAPVDDITCEEDIANQNGYFHQLGKLLTNPIYMATIIAISGLYFVVTGIQYWISDYLRNVLHAPASSIFVVYLIVSLTAPTIGVIVGGAIVHNCGGYSGDKAMPICILFSLFAISVGIPVPFVNEFYPFAILVWLLLFFGGAMMPGLMGIMISSVHTRHRSFANSTSQTFQNLLGFMPAPVLYGMLNQLTGSEGSRAGMMLLMFWSVPSVIMLLIAYYAKRKSQSSQLKKKLLEPVKVRDPTGLQEESTKESGFVGI